MADPLADPDDIADFWRPLSDAEQGVAESLIEVASALIRRRIPGIDALIQAGTVDIVLVRYAISEMIRSAVEASSRPADAKSTAETVGPYSLSITYAATSHIALPDSLAGMLGAATTELGSARLGTPQRYQRGHRYAEPC